LSTATYAVVIERAGGNHAGYVPDLPGCVAAADTEDEVRSLLQEAIALHIESLRQHGEAVPEPTTHAEMVQVEVAA
jgi:predicted RNase H-like HicB family nuclease